MVFLMIFSKIIFFRFYFFDIKLIENLALLFFSLKHRGLLQCFHTRFLFFLMIFSKFIFVNFIFFNIELVENLTM